MRLRKTRNKNIHVSKSRPLDNRSQCKIRVKEIRMREIEENF